MIRAKSSSTFLVFTELQRAKSVGEATVSVMHVASMPNSRKVPTGHQADKSKQKSRIDPNRRGLIHAIGFWGLQRARQRIPRPWCGRFGAVVALLCHSALADRDPSECIAAHTSAQEAADAGRLIEARKLFDSCAAADCPKLIQRDCKVLGRTVEKSTPSIDIAAVDHHGQALTQYQVELDGKALTPDPEHPSTTVDPGNHRVKVIASGHDVADVTIAVRSKDQHQRVVIQLAPPDPIGGRVRNASYVLGAVGAVALTTFVGFAISGHADQRKLDDESHSNTPNDYATADSMRRKYLVADVSLGIGLVSFGVATYLFLITRNASEPTPPGPKASLYVDGTRDAGTIGVWGRF